MAALAAVNDWQELRERIDHAVETLWPLSGAVEQKLQIFFEIANWRARIERVTYERGRVVTDALHRIASIPENEDWSIMVARRFAGTLSGQDAEPFVDYLAEYRT